VATGCIKQPGRTHAASGLDTLAVMHVQANCSSLPVLTTVVSTLIRTTKKMHLPIQYLCAVKYNYHLIAQTESDASDHINMYVIPLQLNF
jgi:hypothetical protein